MGFFCLNGIILLEGTFATLNFYLLQKFQSKHRIVSWQNLIPHKLCKFCFNFVVRFACLCICACILRGREILFSSSSSVSVTSAPLHSIFDSLKSECEKQMEVIKGSSHERGV